MMRGKRTEPAATIEEFSMRQVVDHVERKSREVKKLRLQVIMLAVFGYALGAALWALIFAWLIGLIDDQTIKTMLGRG